LDSGLFLHITDDGKKYWRLNYRYAGKQKTLAVGIYPQISLLEARKKRDDAKKLISEGVDPSLDKQLKKQKIFEKSENSFEIIAREWHAKQEKKLTPDYWNNKLHRLELDIFPKIGAYPISDISPQQILAAVSHIEKRGANEMARRALQMCGQIFRYAVITGRCEIDPTQSLKGALESFKKGHYASLDIDKLPQFLKDLDRNDCRLFVQTRNAIQLMLLTFVRTGELIAATWQEINLDTAMWIIPANRMKMRRDHLVPLSRQAIIVLKDMQRFKIENDYIFPSQVHGAKHMSNNTILKALQRLGYKGEMTGHGFRALAMSTINERLGYRHEVIDRQLAHAPKNKVDAAYDRALFLNDRKKMMQG
jgi:integrase